MSAFHPATYRAVSTLLYVLLASTIPSQAQDSLPSAPEPSTENTRAEQRITHSFSREWLINQAMELSRSPSKLPEFDEESPLADLAYDDYKRISFDSDAAIWARQDRNFMIDLFHPGFLFTRPVNINLVVNGTSRRVLYTTDIFHYEEPVEEVKEYKSEGYSGFRVYHPTTNDERYDEFLAFQGASYFRSTGSDQLYGLSARGLAINTARPEGEEFPYFTDFWIERPETEADSIIIHALLDSPSVAGAYTFTIEPGLNTVIDVNATLFPRDDLAYFGIAPLTSMFLFDATNRNRFDDFRPAVHNSDGLQIHMQNGEQIWRPLANPVQLQSSHFMVDSPEGFGLLQRHSDFQEFKDAEAHYEKHSSLWIEPLDDWGAGQVVLFEIPSNREIYDNIVVYWQPNAEMAAGSRHEFNYRMHWGRETSHASDQGKVVDSAIGGVPNSNEKLFVIDYSNGRNISDEDTVRIEATTSAGEITSAQTSLVDTTGNYRAYVKLDPRGNNLAELRVSLFVNDEKWGETWLYRWTQ